MMLKRTRLGQDAIEYILEQLREGNAYAKVLSEAEFTGKVVTFIPKEVNPAQIEGWQSAKFKTEIRTGREKTRELISSFLQENELHVALVETDYDPASPILLREIPPVLFNNNEVYYLLKNIGGMKDINKAFSSARHYPFICGLIDLSDHMPDLQANQHIPGEVWKDLVTKTQSVIVGAYDNEGYLIWERTDQGTP